MFLLALRLLGRLLSVGAIDASASFGGVAGSIFLGANVTGTNGPAATDPTGAMSFSLLNSQSVVATEYSFLFYSAGSPTAPSTISVVYSSAPSSVTISPGVYSSISGQLTLALGGDSRTLVPLVSSSPLSRTLLESLSIRWVGHSSFNKMATTSP